MNYRRLMEVLVFLSIMCTAQWLMHPIREYEALLRRSKDVNRPSDIFLIEGRQGIDYLTSTCN